jgi:nitrate reductase assembly molybdenum cofactor insertion protein NarJ
MSGAVTLDARVAAGLREAAAWRLLGRLFECPSPAWRDEIEALAREIDDPPLREAASEGCRQGCEGRYHTVFGPGGPAPPREVSYRDTLELGTLMADLAARYDAFGYRPRTPEPPDHVAVEVGFLAYLALKEAYALASGAVEQAALARRAAECFRAEHLAMMAEPLAGLLHGSGISYLARAAAILAERVGPRPQSGRLPIVAVASDDEEGSTFLCAP